MLLRRWPRPIALRRPGRRRARPAPRSGPPGPARRPWSARLLRMSVPVSVAEVDPPPNNPAKPPPPPPRPPPPPPLGETVRVLLPSWLIESCTLLLDPVPTATRMMTAATPIMMPRVVSAERTLLAVTPRQANLSALTHVHALASRSGGEQPRRQAIQRVRDVRQRRSFRRASGPPAWRGRRPRPRG